MESSISPERLRGMPLFWRVVVSTLLSSLLLAGCGGGGGGSGGGSGGGGGGGGNGNGESLFVSPSSVTVSVTTIDPTPTAEVAVTIGNAVIGFSYYVAATTTNSGVATINVANGSSAFQATGIVVINFKPAASLGVGTYTDTVTIRGCYDQGCSSSLTGSPQTVAVRYTVGNPMPTVTQLNPSSSSAGTGAFALTVYGTEFTSNAVVNWNGAARPTTYVSSTQLTAQIAAGDVATNGAIPVTVTNPGVATSGAMTFTINPPALTSVSPTFIAAGGPAFTLDVIGSGFSGSSVVQWNGSARTTTFVSATELQAQIAPTDIAAVGAASITVLTPSASGGPTAALPVTIATLPSWPSSGHAVAYHINPGHTGAVTFSSVTFPTSSSWTVDLGGTVSYALIANGKVYVTATTASGSSLYALDQTTGGTVWGPVAIGGFGSPAYDNGVVFVASGVNPSGGQGGQVALGSVQAYDAATGALLWNTPMSGFDSSSTSAPTAMNGSVYVAGGATDPRNSGTFALDESTGAVSWFSPYPDAADSSPAVGASGVYVDFICGAYGYNPTTGQQLWASPPRCASGGPLGTTPFLDGNSVFVPTVPSGGFGGDVLDATTGASLGSFSTSVPPAFDAQTGYFVLGGQYAGGSGNLQATALSSNTPTWTFTGESSVCAVVVVSQYVIAEGCGGKLYGLDAATGQQVWLENPGPPPIWDFTSRLPLQTLAAGDGVLIVPAGTKLIAYTLSTSP